MSSGSTSVGLGFGVGVIGLFTVMDVLALIINPTVTLSLLDGGARVLTRRRPGRGALIGPGKSKRATWSATLPADGLPYYETVPVEDRDTTTC